MHDRTRSLLGDMLRAAEGLYRKYGTITDEAYLDDMYMQWSVERGLEILGEAARRLNDFAPDIAEQVPEIRGIIGTRNAIAHGYDTVDHHRVLFIVREKLPQLTLDLRAILGD